MAMLSLTGRLLGRASLNLRKGRETNSDVLNFVIFASHIHRLASLSLSANQDNLTYCILKYRSLLQRGGLLLSLPGIVMNPIVPIKIKHLQII